MKCKLQENKITERCWPSRITEGWSESIW